MNTTNDSSLHTSSMDIAGIAGVTAMWVLEVPVHAAILWRISTGAATTLASDIFTLNLSALEILFSVFCALYLFIKIHPMYFFNAGLIFTGRPLFQSCICVERFLAVVHPVLFLKCKPLRYRVACSVLAWLVVIGFSLLSLLLGVTGALLGGTEAWLYLAEGEFLFFMLVMLFCSLAILRALKRAAPGDTGGRDRERDDSIKRRAFIIVCLILVSFLVCYLTWAVAIAVFVGQGNLHSFQMKLVIGICNQIAMLSGFVHPLLYLCQKTGKLPCFKPLQGA